jgi:hypothetical protein
MLKEMLDQMITVVIDLLQIVILFALASAFVALMWGILSILYYAWCFMFLGCV